jgi:hypothetical protein
VGLLGDDRLEGVVAEFDEQVGLGVVAAAGGGVGCDGGRYRFHCTQIADRSRTIPVGERVSFVVLSGRGGVWEAGDLRSASGGVVGGDEG